MKETSGLLISMSVDVETRRPLKAGICYQLITFIAVVAAFARNGEILADDSAGNTRPVLKIICGGTSG